jgi:hypothetical protein
MGAIVRIGSSSGKRMLPSVRRIAALSAWMSCASGCGSISNSWWITSIGSRQPRPPALRAACSACTGSAGQLAAMYDAKRAA